MKRVCTLCAVAILLALSCAREKPGPLSQGLHTEDGWIKDGKGRVMLLRGANYMGIEFGWFNQSRYDFELMKDWGFNTVRLPISWNYLEPEPGVYDPAYLWNVDRVIEWCRELGIFVLLDMHQWQWSPCFKGNGAPQWTCAQYGKDDMFLAAGDFWKDEGLQAHLISAWTMVAQKYAGENTIIGYDLFNEPNPGTLVSMNGNFEREYLMPFYKRLVSAIRSVDPGHMLFMEPAITHGYLPGNLENPGASNMVYSVHVYTGGTWDGVTGYNGDPSPLEQEIVRSISEAQALHMPFHLGEFGVGSAALNAAQWVRDELNIHDKYLLGSLYWTFWRDDTAFGLLDSQGREKTAIVNILSRPYSMYTAGIPEELSFDDDTKEFTLVFGEDSRAQDPTEIFLPAQRQYPNGFTVSLSDGTFSWDETTQTLTHFRDRHLASHRIMITPAL